MMDKPLSNLDTKMRMDLRQNIWNLHSFQSIRCALDGMASMEYKGTRN